MVYEQLEAMISLSLAVVVGPHLLLSFALTLAQGTQPRVWRLSWRMRKGEPCDAKLMHLESALWQRQSSRCSELVFLPLFNLPSSLRISGSSDSPQRLQHMVCMKMSGAWSVS